MITLMITLMISLRQKVKQLVAAFLWCGCRKVRSWGTCVEYQHVSTSTHTRGGKNRRRTELSQRAKQWQGDTKEAISLSSSRMYGECAPHRWTRPWSAGARAAEVLPYVESNSKLATLLTSSFTKKGYVRLRLVYSKGKCFKHLFKLI